MRTRLFLGNYHKSGWNNMWDHLCLTKHISCWHFTPFIQVCGVSLGLLARSSYVKVFMVYVYFYNVICIGLWHSFYLFEFPSGPDDDLQTIEPHHTVVLADGECCRVENKVFSPSCYSYEATLVVFVFIQVYCKFSIFIPFIITSRQLKSLTLC